MGIKPSPLGESFRFLIQKQYWGRHLWARGYFVATSGNVTDEAIAEYIRGQDGTEPSDGDDKFQVTPS
jgi:putative transposase